MSIEAMVSQELPEGWYDDPENPRLQRFWTGSDWTEHVRHSPGTARPRAAFTLETPAVAMPAFALSESAPTPAFSSPPPTFDAAVKKFPVYEPPVAAYEAPAVPMPAYEAPVAPMPVFDAPIAYIGGAAAATVAPIEGDTAYVPMSHYYMPSTARVGSSNLRAYGPSTGAVWFLAVSPLVWAGLQLLTLISAPASAVVSLAISGAVLVSMLLSVVIDNVVLRRRNIEPPAVGWFLLGVAPYFVARWWALREQGIRYIAPGIGFAVAIAASVAVWVLALGVLN